VKKAVRRLSPALRQQMIHETATPADAPIALSADSPASLENAAIP
jgi:hypothetical protein